MDFLKKHYEKIILAIVLLGLAGAAALLPIKVNTVKDGLSQLTGDIQNPRKPGQFQPFELTNQLATLSRLTSQARVDFSFPHLVFNPLRWEKKDKTLVKQSTPRVGADAVEILGITPLHLELTFQRADVETLRYEIGVLRQTERSARPRSRLVKVGEKNEVFTLKDVKGPPEAPTELVLELADGKRLVSISKEKPYRQILGYSADLRYEPENKSWPKARPGDKLTVDKATHKIIEITESEVVLSEDQPAKDQSGTKEMPGKRTILVYRAPKN
jgi:hypothetical protein